MNKSVTFQDFIIETGMSDQERIDQKEKEKKKAMKKGDDFKVEELQKQISTLKKRMKRKQTNEAIGEDSVSVEHKVYNLLDDAKENVNTMDDVQDLKKVQTFIRDGRKQMAMKAFNNLRNFVKNTIYQVAEETNRTESIKEYFEV